jgi:hypothetical protein
MNCRNFVRVKMTGSPLENRGVKEISSEGEINSILA